MLAIAQIIDCTAHSHRYVAQTEVLCCSSSCVPSSSSTKSRVRKLVFKSDSNDTVSCWRQQDRQATLASQSLPFKNASFSRICCCRAANYCTSRTLVRRQSAFGATSQKGRPPPHLPTVVKRSQGKLKFLQLRFQH